MFLGEVLFASTTLISVLIRSDIGILNNSSRLFWSFEFPSCLYIGGTFRLEYSQNSSTQIEQTIALVKIQRFYENVDISLSIKYSSISKHVNRNHIKSVFLVFQTFFLPIYAILILISLFSTRAQCTVRLNET